MTSYPPTFYQQLHSGVRQSAEVVVPVVMELLGPRSVVDVGCGLGTWLSAFADHGVKEILGLDGAYVDRESLEIPADCFLPFDLAKPLRLDRRFDLVVSLEVAEHLAPECAETFVDSLTRLAPMILFSAAIPFQEGQHHVNEQWPEYWSRQFQRRGFATFDCFRSRIWGDDRVQWWYRQNLLLFVDEAAIGDDKELRAEIEREFSSPLSLVHPGKYLEIVEKYQTSQTDLWQLRSEVFEQDLRHSIPRGETLILVDQDQLNPELTTPYRVLPFPERDGKFWGPPDDDRSAIEEVERLRRAGAGFLVFAWPAFWWLEHYLGLTNHLRSNYRCLAENDRVIAFNLRENADGCASK